MIIDEPVVFAHIDCDWYDSVNYCLAQIHPNMKTGSRFLIDDYFHYSGCRKAVDEFLQMYPEDYVKLEKDKLHLIRK